MITRPPRTQIFPVSGCTAGATRSPAFILQQEREDSCKGTDGSIAAREKILKYLARRLTAVRLRHVRATRDVAVDLARRNDVDPHKAELAALLHDAARGMTNKAMIAYVRKYRVPVPDRDSVIARHPSLLHSYVAADIAHRRFGISDAGIRGAVAHHTLGAARMDALSKIIYLSDVISADRRYRGVGKLREIARQDLETALRLAMKNKIEYVLSAREWLHPVTVAAWNALVPQGQHEKIIL